MQSELRNWISKLSQSMAFVVFDEVFLPSRFVTFCSRIDNRPEICLSSCCQTWQLAGPTPSLSPSNSYEILDLEGATKILPSLEALQLDNPIPRKCRLGYEESSKFVSEVGRIFI